MTAPSRSAVEVLTDQVALVEAAADFATLKLEVETKKGELARGLALVVQIARRLEPGVLTDDEAVARAIPAAKAALARGQAVNGGVRV